MDRDIEEAAESVVRTAKRTRAPLLEAIELAQAKMEEAAKGLEQALVEAKQALTVLELLRHQIENLRSKIESKTRR
jgi:type III secretory pathway component EscU